MKEEINYVLKIWTNKDTNFGFSDLEEAKEKMAELQKELKSNQRIEMSKETLQTEILPF